MPALVLLLLLQLELEGLPLAALAVEGIVGAAIVDELALVEMDDAVDRGVEQVAVVADEEHAPRIAGEVALEPHRALEVEIVGRLVEEEKIGLGEQDRGERHPHPPAAGERRARPALRLLVEAETGEDRGGARLGRMGVDVGEAGLDLGDAVGVGGGFGLGEEGVPLDVGGKHDVDQGLLARRSLLRHLADAGVLRQADRTGLRRDLAGDQAEQGGLAAAVPADEAGLRAVLKRDGGVVEQEPRPDPVGDVVEMQHGGGLLPHAPLQTRGGANVRARMTASGIDACKSPSRFGSLSISAV